MSAADKKALDLLFQRPLEPAFTSRDNGKSALILPDSFYTDRYKGEAIELESRYGDDVDTKIPLKDIKKPDLSFITVGRKKHFSLFNEKHKTQAGRLIQVFLDAPDLPTFAGLAAYVKDRVNPVMFQYCYTIAIEHRPDTKDVNVPPIAEQFPSQFVEPSVLQDARAEGSLVRQGNRMVLDIPRNYTANPRELEQRLSYFREDIGVNMHHWHWHLVYPGRGPSNVINKDRRGELFYYMHQQIIARYNVDRYCNELPSVKPLNNLRQSIPEGYFPKILSSVNNRTYPGRIASSTLQDLNREEGTSTVADMERWTDRIHLAIDQGFVTDARGNQIPLDENRGIDLLGNIIEPSDLSANPQLYGSLHGVGHDMIAYIHDPDARFLEDLGVMGDVATAMRDPIFYRWHCNIDNIFKKHKALLRQYNQQELDFTGVRVNSIEAKISSARSQPNTLLTYWQKSDVDIGAGLDFGPNGNVYASFTHLQHAPFEYTINVTNSGAPRRGTARIFLCPKTDERGAALNLNEVRQLAIELDKFTVNLQAGQNMIKRRSDESTVTIPFERSFRRVGAADTPQRADELARFRFCGCGWPQHMLLPKGNAAGMQFDLYVMISDYTGDEVRQTNQGDVCGDAASFCGLKDQLYPDRRSMGFPFDRVLTGQNLGQFAQTYENMSVSNLTIKFNDTTVDRT